MKFSAFIFFFIAVFYSAGAQLWPGENSELNYRLVGFSFPSSPELQAHSYVIEIACGKYTDDHSFKKQMVVQVQSATSKVIVTLPFFGTQYTWRTVYKRSGKKDIYSKFHHFSTLTIPNVDTSFTRLRIVDDAKQYKDAYVLMDGSRVLYDMKGAPLWFLPDIDSLIAKGGFVRDLKHTVQGTITFLAGNQQGFNAYEVNYNGKILWRGPDNGIASGGKSEDYHHEFTRLCNGNYMILGNEWLDVFLKISANKDSSLIFGNSENHLSSAETVIKIDHKPFGILVEYDERGNVVWSYRSSNYFRTSDLLYNTDADGKINVNVHDNAFFFDEKAKVVYMSFKDINRIVKIRYPDGTVLASYGEPCKGSKYDAGLFCGQHCCRRSDSGYLYLFNNNTCNAPANPKITLLREPATQNDTLKKVWEYEFTNEGLTNAQLSNLSSVSGGSVFELADHSFFSCMGNMQGITLIVNRGKEVLWKAVPETWDKNLKRWNILAQYRADIIMNRHDLEQLIWKSGEQ